MLLNLTSRTIVSKNKQIKKKLSYEIKEKKKFIIREIKMPFKTKIVIKKAFLCSWKHAYCCAQKLKPYNFPPKPVRLPSLRWQQVERTGRKGYGGV